MSRPCTLRTSVPLMWNTSRTMHMIPYQPIIVQQATDALFFRHVRRIQRQRTGDFAHLCFSVAQEEKKSRCSTSITFWKSVTSCDRRPLTADRRRKRSAVGGQPSEPGTDFQKAILASLTPS